uniref:UGT72B3 (UDP-GLUCOSYL TRANSFERASE 72B3) n=1 Tax=Arundo donax TaxID=35708 RepID=A0A0A9CER2_ARUDO
MGSTGWDTEPSVSWEFHNTLWMELGSRKYFEWYSVDRVATLCGAKDQCHDVGGSRGGNSC